MIDKIRLRNFKGHQDTTVPLGRLTMLVGDNGSGKTSVLEALSLQSRMGPAPHLALQEDRAPTDLLRRNADGGIVIRSHGTRHRDGANVPWSSQIEVKPDAAGKDEWTALLLAEFAGQDFKIGHQFTCSDTRFTAPIIATPLWDVLPELLIPAPLFGLDAQAIAAGTFGAAQTDRWLDERGTKTAAVLADMKLDRDEDFQRVEDSLRRLVPAVRRIRLQPIHRAGLAGRRISFDFHGAPNIPAHGASHGTLIALSLLTILYGPSRPNLVLLDDFDHALHPRAQMELVKMLKSLLALEEFADLQIVATTHSPYVLDELSPSEVQVFALRPDGTVASKRLSEHPEAEKTKGTLSAGQLWSMDPERDWVIGG